MDNMLIVEINENDVTFLDLNFKKKEKIVYNSSIETAYLYTRKHANA